MMRVSLVWWGIVSPPGRATPTAREPACPYMAKTEADRLCLSAPGGLGQRWQTLLAAPGASGKRQYHRDMSAMLHASPATTEQARQKGSSDACRVLNHPARRR